MTDDALQILLGSRRPGDMGRGAKRYDDFWAIHVVYGVDMHVSYGVEHHHLEGDWVWFGHPGPFMRFAPSGRMPRQHYRFAMRGALLDEWRDEGLWPEAPLPVRDRAPVTQACELLLDSLQGEGVFDRRRQRHAVEGLLIALQLQQREARPQENWLTAVRGHIDAHCLDTIDYESLGRRWLMPLHRLRKEFRRAMGMPIHEYCLRARCRRAQELVLDSDEPLAVIAERCGYKDVGFFSRQFKRFTGLTPGSLRRSRFA